MKTPNRNSKWLYACFRSEEDKNIALDVLNKFNWKNTILDVSVSILYLCIILNFI